MNSHGVTYLHKLSLKVRNRMWLALANKYDSLAIKISVLKQKDEIFTKESLTLFLPHHMKQLNFSSILENWPVWLKM